MMASLYAHAAGVKWVDPALGIPSTAVVLSLLAFAVNVWANAKKAAAPAAGAAR